MISYTFGFFAFTTVFAATLCLMAPPVDQDRPLALTFNDVGLREQWIPTHHCSREIKRGVMENLA
jgi:hypothetical protein